MITIHRAATVAVATAAALLVAVPATAPTADAASAIRFSYAQFDSPGSDTGSNTSLNAEYVRIKNYGSTSRSLKGWTVRDAANHVYTFGTLTLKPGATVTLHTGKGSNRAGQRYWGKTWYVWNNTGDTATLKNASGAKVDACAWKGSGSTTSC